MMMENKMTAMQTLMEWMIEESQVIPVDAEETYNKAKELLAMEQDNIIASWENGFWEGCEEEISGNSGLQYYNETYGKQDN
jgi:hypothetical protein